ncbi:hypothetical protein PV325_000273 [Microctonus aethiopoides]|nr:hypothetical protein PV325_000273 [Microctonus aethiopoides]
MEDTSDIKRKARRIHKQKKKKEQDKRIQSSTKALASPRYGSTNLTTVPAVPGTNDNFSTGGPQRGSYTAASSNMSKYHPYGR